MRDLLVQRLIESLERDREHAHARVRELRTEIRLLVVRVRDCIDRGKVPQRWIADEADEQSKRIAVRFAQSGGGT
ncbi:MAG TPA: hypothetical protein VLT45_30920 [Kofleriaceae bacterium]|nr:hypothetical protein [Kofleriaceae bacterium]